MTTVSHDILIIGAGCLLGGLIGAAICILGNAIRIMKSKRTA